jgi:hypothetical protein
MKIFIAYRYTGENTRELEKILSNIKNILESKGCDIFCSLFLDEHFKNEGFSSQEIYDYCLLQLQAHSSILFFIKSEEKSKGMALELEAAIKNRKKIVLAIRKHLHFPEYRKAAHQIIEYDELSNLYDLLSMTELFL